MNHVEAAILSLGGAANKIPVYQDSLGDYLSAVGVRWTTGAEWSIPYGALRRRIMRQCGYTSLTPPRLSWPVVAALALVIDRCRNAARGPVIIKWAWRPPEVNRLAGGAPESDHLMACAADVVFASVLAKQRALNQVLEPLYRLNLWDISLGVGWKTVHVGLFSEKGHRRWTYGK